MLSGSLTGSHYRGYSITFDVINSIKGGMRYSLLERNVATTSQYDTKYYAYLIGEFIIEYDR